MIDQVNLASWGVGKLEDYGYCSEDIACLPEPSLERAMKKGEPISDVVRLKVGSKSSDGTSGNVCLVSPTCKDSSSSTM